MTSQHISFTTLNILTVEDLEGLEMSRTGKFDMV
jgi:hypothetical protein